MNINVWNLSQTKTTFFIRERKQAQKKHLQKLKHVKSTIDLKNCTQTSNQFHPIGNRSRIEQKQCQQHSPNSIQNSAQQSSIIQSMVRRTKFPNANLSYIDNLRVSSSLSRLRQSRQIQRQNGKLIQRLIKAKPSISQTQFKKNHLSHLKYKENILRNKYLNPDYSRQVKIGTKSFSHLMLKPIHNLTKFTDAKITTSRVKTSINEQPKSENHRFANYTCHQHPRKQIQS